MTHRFGARDKTVLALRRPTAAPCDDEDVVLVLHVHTTPLMHYKLIFPEGKPAAKCLLNGDIRHLPTDEDYTMMVDGETPVLYSSNTARSSRFYDTVVSFCESTLLPTIIAKASGAMTRVHRTAELFWCVLAAHGWRQSHSSENTHDRLGKSSVVVAA